MKKSLLILLLIAALLLSACGFSDNEASSVITESEVSQTEKSKSEKSKTEEISVDTSAVVVDEETENEYEISYVSGTENAYTVTESDGELTVTFGTVSEETVYSISGVFRGQIVIDVGDENKFELELNGLTLSSKSVNPISVLSGDTVKLTAKKETANFITDSREAVSEEEISACVYSLCDLTIGGKGSLTVTSENNNGIHTKDDLKVKNLTLTVVCEDNALKGNDSVTVTEGSITLVAKTGDGIKTTSTDISEKSNQRGTVLLDACTLNIFAACDGIDAAYNVEIGDGTVLNIKTDSYSEYSESVEKSSDGDVYYIRFTSNKYSYSVKYYNSDDDYKWVNASYYKSVSGGMSTYYYYSFDKLTSYSSVQIFMYSSGEAQGQEDDYTVKSDYMTWNTSYDTFALEQRGTSLSYNWTNYTTSTSGGWGGRGGMGGMNEGNSDKSEYSTKGIKAGNEVIITGGEIDIESYDDAIHANSESTLENGSTPTGDVKISGGNITLFSKDDGIHADGNLTVYAGNITVTGCYEGLEGTTITVNGGNISVTSKDDGFNSTSESGVGITFNDGTVYIYAGGDGIDANSKTSYKGIIFVGGKITVISTSGGNSSIDTEQGYTYTGGSVLALCPSNGMGSESTRCTNFSSIATKSTLSLKNGNTLSVTVKGEVVQSVTMPCALSALVIYLGSNSASFNK